MGFLHHHIRWMTSWQSSYWSPTNRTRRLLWRLPTACTTLVYKCHTKHTSTYFKRLSWARCVYSIHLYICMYSMYTVVHIYVRTYVHICVCVLPHIVHFNIILHAVLYMYIHRVCAHTNVWPVCTYILCTYVHTTYIRMCVLAHTLMNVFVSIVGRGCVQEVDSEPVCADRSLDKGSPRKGKKVIIK